MNNCFISFTAVEIKNVVTNFKDSHRILFSNYYGVNEQENFEILKLDRSILIRKKSTIFIVYFYYLPMRRSWSTFYEHYKRTLMY